MPEFNQEAFDNFVVGNDVIGFFKDPIRLKSGRTSNWYVNWREPTSDIHNIDYIANQIIAFTADNGLNPDTFYGVPEGASKLGVITQYLWSQQNLHQPESGEFSLPMGRGNPKEHGIPKDRFFLGMPKGRTVVIEDVTTTGGSLLEELAKLKSADVHVVAALGLTNRMELRDDRQSVRQAVEAVGVPYFQLSSALDILPKVYAKIQPGEEVGRAIEKEFEKYGVEKLKLVGV